MQMKDTSVVSLLNSLALAYYPAKIDSMRYFAEEALMLSEQLGDITGKARALRFIGITYYYKTDYDKALHDYYYPALELLQGREPGSDLASVYNNIAIIYDIRGNNEGALDYYLKSLEINTSIGHKKGIAYNQLNIGLISYNLGRILQALDSQMEALRICEEINDRNGMSLALNNIASIYNTLERYDEAIEKNRQALEIRKEIGAESGISSSLYNIGYIHMINHRIDSALYYFDQSFEIAKRIDDFRNQNLILTAKGDLAHENKNIIEAEELYNQALKINQRIKDQFNIGRTLIKLSQIDVSKSDYNSALQKAQSAWQIGERINNRNVIQISSKQLADVYERLGNIRESYTYYKTYVEVSDSLNNSEIQRRSARMDAEYEYLKLANQLKIEQTEKELQNVNRLNKQIGITLLLLLISLSLGIILYINNRNRVRLQSTLDELKNSNAAIENQREKLQVQTDNLNQANKTQRRLISIISHDMKSPLAYASMALDMLQGKDQTYIDKTLPLVKNNVNNVYNLMEDLLDWSKVQMDKEEMVFENISPHNALSRAIVALSGQAQEKNIQIINKLTKKHLVITDKTLLEVVFRNLISNAIKFSYRDNQIVVFEEEESNYLKICVEDKGTGITPKDLEKIFGEKGVSREGTNKEKGTGLGLSLSKEIIEKNKGKLWIESTEKQGTKVWFSLPMATPVQT